MRTSNVPSVHSDVPTADSAELLPVEFNDAFKRKFFIDENDENEFKEPSILVDWMVIPP